MAKLNKEKLDFYARSSEIVAKLILGGEIIRKMPDRTIRGIILETGAYQGGKLTQSRTGMLYKPGTIFLMPFRGLTSLNISTDEEYFASCVEVRAAKFNEEMIETPYMLSKFLSLNYKASAKNLDGKLLGDELSIDLPKRYLANSKIIVSRPSIKSDNCIAYYRIK